MPLGTIKWFDEAEGFGFIQRDEGPDVYVDGSAIVGPGLRSLDEGQAVEFEIARGPRGPHAKNVKPVRA